MSITNHRRTVGVVVVWISLTACGGSGGGAEPAATSTVPTTPASVASTTSSTSTTSTSTTSTTSTTVPPTTAPAAATSATSACLQGVWLMDDATTAGFYSALLPGFPLIVQGSHQVTFDGVTVEYFINELLDFSPTGQNIVVPYDSRSAGTFTLDGDVIVFDYLTVDGAPANAQGTLEDSDGNQVPVDSPVIGPDFQLPALGGGPVSCDGDSMSILYSSGLAEATADFVRI